MDKQLKYAISRPAGGITINTQREYLFHPGATPMMSPDVKPILFDSSELAEEYCKDKDINIEDELIDIVHYNEE